MNQRINKDSDNEERMDRKMQGGINLSHLTLIKHILGQGYPFKSRTTMRVPGWLS